MCSLNVTGNLTLQFVGPTEDLFQNQAFNRITAALEGPLCPRGTFSETGRPVNGSCERCPPGTWNAVPGAEGKCASLCVAGHSCPAGSTSGTASPCPAGQYSPAGVGACTACAPGRWSAALALAAPCDGRCEAGYACPSGSSSGRAVVCPAGKYSGGGTAACTDCSPGKWSADVNRSEACTRNCSAGYTCPAGSVSGTVSACAAGLYSHAGSEACSP
jgi:hypothetical protein